MVDSHYVLALDASPEMMAARISDHPETIGIPSYEFGAGKSLLHRFPKGARYRFSDELPDNRNLFDLQSNGLGVPVISSRLADMLGREKGVELLQIVLVNHRGEVAAGRYSLLNLLEPVDCVDIEASDAKLNRLKPGMVNRFRRLVFVPERVPADRRIFSLACRPSTVVVNDSLRLEIESAGMTGMCFVALEQFDSMKHLGV